MVGLNVDGNLDVSVESKNLSSSLSQDCYLFFSVGSRLTYLGFRAAYEALSRSQSSAMRLDSAHAASSYLRDAAKYWHNPSHVMGINLNGENDSDIDNSDDSIAKISLENGSLVARAASILMELNDVIGVVNVCLICAGNFSEVSPESKFESNLAFPESMIPWEKDLYHRPMTDTIEGSLPNHGLSSQLVKKPSTRAHMNNKARDTCNAILFHHLGKLILSCAEFPQNNVLKEKMISVASSSTSLSFLHALYRYLLKSGNTDTLLRIESLNVKNWLIDVQKDNHLLWRYYVVHGLDWIAGEVMWKHGCSKESNISLNERIEALTRAMTSYSAAMKSLESNSKRFQLPKDLPQSENIEKNVQTPSHGEIGNMITQISEQIDIAKLQSRTLSVLQASQAKLNVDEDRLLKLSHTLLNVSTLYNDYAAPLGFYDLCLLIMQTCQYDDEETICTLWKSIICEELLPCRTSNKIVERFLSKLRSGSMLEEVEIVFSDSDVTCEKDTGLKVFEDGEWITNLKNRIICLGKELNGKDVHYIFPIGFIAECLEGLQRVFQISTNLPSQSWPHQTLLKGGIKFLPLMEAYNNLFLMQTNEASVDPKMKLSQLSTLNDILVQWLSSVYSDAGKESNRIELIQKTESILIQVDSYKEALESIVGCHPDDIAKVYASLSNVENTLRRNT